MSSYRHNVQKNGSTLSFLVGENVIGELVYCWGEKKCQSHHTSAVWQGSIYTQPNPKGLCDFKMSVHLWKIGLRYPVGSAGSVTSLLSLTTGLSNTTKMSCIPKNSAPQPERSNVKCKWNSSLWSSSINAGNTVNTKDWIFKTHEMVQNIFRSCSTYSTSHYSTSSDWTWKATGTTNHRKASAILRAWTHTELKQARRKKTPMLRTHHPGLQLEHSVIMVPPYGSGLWVYSHSTVHLAGDRSGASPRWDAASVGNGLYPTCLCQALAAGWHLVLACNKQTTLPAYCLHRLQLSKLQLAFKQTQS